jgi:hypothetical protein
MRLAPLSNEPVDSFHTLLFWGLPRARTPADWPHTTHQANPTAGGPRQSLTSEIRLTPLSQEVPSARTT